MTTLFGSTRAVVKRNYALLTPDGFVPSALPGWSNAVCHVVISPAMGARFVQSLVTLARNGRGAGRTGSGQLFAYMLDGDCTMRAGRRKFRLVSESYAYLPPGTNYEFSHAADATRLLLFEKPYVALPGTAAPDALVDTSGERPGLPFLGDPAARLQTLLPERPEFDMAVNIFTYQPGATLPMVETHVMEHGLLMLAGQGVYRLGEDWHPVREGDVIWMASYCPQWFVAMGKSPASYIYYKDVNRA